MKIAILVSGFPPKRLAGTEIATYNIARHLAKRGHEVHVITSRDKGLLKESIEEGFYIHRGRVIGKPFLGFASYFINAFRVIRRVNPDLVHAQTIELALYALLIKKMLKKPYVAWARGSDVYLPSKFYRRFYRFILMNANAVIAQTSDEKRIMQKTCNRDIVVIPNGIDLDRFDNLPKERVRSRLQIGKDEKVILYMGTLRPVKGVKYLIEAMRAVSQKDLEARLIVVGDGKERQNLEKLTKALNLGDFVTFVGKVPNQEVPQYMAAADIFVLPSLSEGFPVTVLEAMASGLSIITTNIGGLPEIVHEGENGFLVQPKNPLEITQRVTLLLQDDELRERISGNNRARAKDYTWKEVVGKLEEVYQNLVTTP